MVCSGVEVSLDRLGQLGRCAVGSERVDGGVRGSVVQLGRGEPVGLQRAAVVDESLATLHACFPG